MKRKESVTVNDQVAYGYLSRLTCASVRIVWVMLQ